MNFIKNNLLLIVCAIASIVFCDSALASTSMPWDTGIKNIQESLTGPVATGISLIGLIAAGAMLVFGGEISGFLKQLIYLVLAISLILCGNSFITNVMDGVAQYTFKTGHMVILALILIPAVNK